MAIRKILKTLNLKDAPLQAIMMAGIIHESYYFIKTNKLWKGFFEQRWILVFTLLISVLFSLALYGDISQWFSAASLDDPENTMNLAAIDVESVKEKISEEGNNALFSSGSKYLLLILLEVITYYFSVRTINILTGRNFIPSFKDFIGAEKRMIQVMIVSFFKGLLVQIFVYILLLLVGLSDYTFVAMFFVYAFYMGYSFIDNYLEQHHKTIKESEYIARQHLGAATTIGIVASGLLYIPVLGPFFTPILGAIAAAIYGNRYQLQSTHVVID